MRSCITTIITITALLIASAIAMAHPGHVAAASLAQANHQVQLALGLLAALVLAAPAIWRRLRHHGN